MNNALVEIEKLAHLSMRALYLTKRTDFEYGWGSRDAGYLLTDCPKKMGKEIARLKTYDTPVEFTRYDETQMVFVEKDDFYALIDPVIKSDGQGVARITPKIDDPLRKITFYILDIRQLTL